MKPTEMAGLIKKENPELFADMPEKKVARVMRAVFDHVGKQIDALTEGAVRVPTFGKFRVRMVEREKNGQKVTIKRLTFNRAKENPAADDKPADRPRKPRKE